MKLTDKQLNYYVDNALAFGPQEKQKYQDQIDHLNSSLTMAINDQTTASVTKVNQAGSWRKGTALKPRDGLAIDIDLVVYLDLSDATTQDVSTLHQKIVALLKATYPNKSGEDFKTSKKTVGITFRQSGLNVDLVPVVPVKDPANYVWQPEVGGGGAFITSPAKQLEFVQGLKGGDPRFASVVRLLKQWRNHTELDALSSFAIELIVANWILTKGKFADLESGVLDVFLYIARSDLSQTISFAGAINRVPQKSTSVHVCDPTNNENNVTARVSEMDRRNIVSLAKNAAETINYARQVDRKNDTISLWKEVFGPSFNIGD